MLAAGRAPESINAEIFERVNVLYAEHKKMLFSTLSIMLKGAKVRRWRTSS